MGSEKSCLPPGYRLDRSAPDVWALRRSEARWWRTSAPEA
jgi:hypothetical protein